MNWSENIYSIFIVEDHLQDKEHNSALVFPQSIASEEAEDLKDCLSNLKSDNDYLYSKIISTIIPPTLLNDFENFIDSQHTNIDKIEEWYYQGGSRELKKLWTQPKYKNEYSFLASVPNSIKLVYFHDYDEAFKFLKTNYTDPTDSKLNLWFLDREINGIEMDVNILNLLEQLSYKESSIAIVYSGNVTQLKDRSDIYTFVEEIINQNIPANLNEEFTKLIEHLKGGNSSPLFLNDDSFAKELYNSLSKTYNERLYLSNLIWVINKSDNISDILDSTFNNAKHGFDIYRLLKLHNSKRKLSLTSGLLKTTKLKLSDIEHLKVKSLDEGTNISETLVRVHDIYSKEQFDNDLYNDNQYAKIMKRIENWEINDVTINPETDLSHLLSHEKFNYNVNLQFNPVSTGDIFEIYTHPSNTGRNSKHYCMLLTQECDCVVREDEHHNIRRKVSVATLIELSRSKIKDSSKPNSNIVEIMSLIKEEIQKGKNIDDIQIILERFLETCGQCAATLVSKSEGATTKLPLSPFSESGEYYKFNAMLRLTSHLDFKLLDLCSLNKDGQGQLPIQEEKIQLIKKDIVPLYPKTYQAHLNNLIDEILLTYKRNNCESTFKEPLDINDLDRFNYVIHNNTIDFKIRRIARLNPPDRILVQAFYGLTQSNIGLPMKF